MLDLIDPAPFLLEIHILPSEELLQRMFGELLEAGIWLEAVFLRGWASLGVVLFFIFKTSSPLLYPERMLLIECLVRAELPIMYFGVLLLDSDLSEVC